MASAVATVVTNAIALAAIAAAIAIASVIATAAAIATATAALSMRSNCLHCRGHPDHCWNPTRWAPTYEPTTTNSH